MVVLIITTIIHKHWKTAETLCIYVLYMIYQYMNEKMGILHHHDQVLLICQPSPWKFGTCWNHITQRISTSEIQIGHEKQESSHHHWIVDHYQPFLYHD